MPFLDIRHLFQVSEIGKELNASRKPLFLLVTEDVEGLEGS